MHCQCGCGRATTIAKDNNVKYGWVKGEHKAYIHGHNRRSGQPAREIKKENGYILRWVHPLDPFISMAFMRSGQYYVYEHRLRMAEWIGRVLRPEEVVHHKNDIKDDNRIENLGLFHTRAAHAKYHGKKRGVLNVR